MTKPSASHDLSCIGGIELGLTIIALSSPQSAIHIKNVFEQAVLEQKSLSSVKMPAVKKMRSLHTGSPRQLTQAAAFIDINRQCRSKVNHEYEELPSRGNFDYLTAQTAALASAVAGLKGERAIKTNRQGEMPVLVCDKKQSAQTKNIVQHILKLINEGMAPNEIVVLGRKKALLHPVEQLLRGQNIDTSRMSVKRDSAHALTVLNLVSLVVRCKKDQKKIDAELLKGALPGIQLDDDSRWKKQVSEIKKVARTSSLEGRYKHCAKIYLRLLGGITDKENKELRADVNRWEPKCRDFKTAKSMRMAIRAMHSEKVVTGTIHAAKGRGWKHVLIVGATEGLLPIHCAKDQHSSGQERNMMYVAITRAKDSVRLYHAPSNYARGRKTFEKLSRFLDTPAVRKMLRVE